MSDSKKSPSLLLEALIENITPASRRKKVRHEIRVYFQDPHQNDGRGRRTSELENTCRALRHLQHMPSWQGNEKYDLNMRRRIGDILKHVDHGQPWAETIKECSIARGLISKAGKRRNERKEYGSSDQIVLGKEFVCHPLNSADKLRSAGKRGRNCLGDRSYRHIDEVRSGEAEFYEIKTTDGLTRAFLEIDRAKREVRQFKGPDNEDVDLPIDVIQAISQKLAVNGDNCEPFVQLGVLTLFSKPHVKRTSPMEQIHDFQLWWQEGEIVVKDLKTNRWSRLKWEFDDWDCGTERWIEAEGSDINVDEFELMQRCQPKLMTIAKKACPPDHHATGVRTQSRRRRRMRF